MENNLKQTLYVEFYGLPGCGKSTISHILAKRLMDDGFTVVEPSFTEDHRTKFVRKIIKLLYGCYGYVFHHSTYRKISGLVYENGYVGFEKFTQTVNVLQKVNVYRKDNTKKIVIWDQGIIQASISLSVTEHVEAFDNYRFLEEFFSKNSLVIRIYMPIDKNMALERMAGRKTNDSRVERIGGYSNKMKLLDNFEDGIKSIRDGLKEYNVEIVVDGHNDISVITDVIYQTIKKNIGEHS